MIIIPPTKSHYLQTETDTYYAIYREENVSDLVSFYNEIANALSFPKYFGKNFDALEEMLNDLCWIPNENIILLIHHNQQLKSALLDDLEELLDILKNIDNPRFHCILVES